MQQNAPIQQSGALRPENLLPNNYNERQRKNIPEMQIFADDRWAITELIHQPPLLLRFASELPCRADLSLLVCSGGRP
jgi:hypothetical protein